MTWVMCKKCKIGLNDNNWFVSCKTNNIYICKECKTAELKSLKETFKYEVERDNYSVKKSKRISSPYIKIKKESDNVLFQMLEDTEKYRIDKLIRLLVKKDTLSEIKEKIIIYLLRSHNLLDSKMIALIINKANAMFVCKDIKEETIVRLANALKTCSLDNKMFKEKAGTLLKTYEQMRNSKAVIEVEVPDL